ncbi:uncharacterized protein LOC132742412 [Ruditapes philippinarum]|uniref:uncharacterized protein LOC132742412 n=1 Tax=Ruditapes philippinarum TaxID=129788 RepID=UPI00295C05FB|nr:uncharacterized protein LOC132742412 [Ruditapes philippinarum]
MEFNVKYEVGIHKMQKVTFPPLRSGIHVSLAAKEPPERSWSRYKKVLIDNPKDSNLLQRQKLWNFQKLNRGAFRSQLTSLPDIPYRVQPNPVEKVSVAVQADLSTRFSQNLKVIFPNLVDKRRRASLNKIEIIESDVYEVIDKPTEENMNTHASKEFGDYSDDFDEDSSTDDPGFEFDSVIRKKNAGTMTEDVGNVKPTMRREKKLKTFRERNMYTYKLPILKQPERKISRLQNEPKNVKFEHDIVSQDTDEENENVEPEELPIPSPDEPEEILSAVSKVEITEIPERVPSAASSIDSRVPRIPLENIGPSSNSALDPVSILDYISGGFSNRSRNSDNGGKKSKKFVSDPEADRVWFEKIVGDKEIIDSGTYENFARSRPSVEEQTDSNTDKYNDLGKSSPRKNFTPRINDEFAVYHSVVAKSSKRQANTVNTTVTKPKNPKRVISIGKSY